MAQSITSIVPDHDIDVSVQEESQIKSMGVIYHMLIEHGVWIAERMNVGRSL